MAEHLKLMYNPAFFEDFCPILSEILPRFDCKDFIFRVFNNDWPEMELKKRVRHLSLVLHHFLDEGFPEASEQLLRIARALSNKDIREQGLEYIFLADYVQVFGSAYPKESLKVLEEIAKLVSKEILEPENLSSAENVFF